MRDKILTLHEMIGRNLRESLITLALQVCVCVCVSALVCKQSLKRVVIPHNWRDGRARSCGGGGGLVREYSHGRRKEVE